MRDAPLNRDKRQRVPRKPRTETEGESRHMKELAALRAVIRGETPPDAAASLRKVKTWAANNLEREPRYLYDTTPNIEMMEAAVASTIDPEGVAEIVAERIRRELSGEWGWGLGEFLSNDNYGDWRYSAELTMLANPRMGKAHDALRENLRRWVGLLALVSAPGEVTREDGKPIRSGLLARCAGGRSPVLRQRFGAGYEMLPGLLACADWWGRKPGDLAAHAILRGHLVVESEDCLPLSGPDVPTVQRFIGDCRPAIRYLVRRYRSGAVFTCILGRSVGHNTAPTWGVLVTGPQWVTIGDGEIRKAYDSGRELVAGDVRLLYPYPQDRIRSAHTAFRSDHEGWITRLAGDERDEYSGGGLVTRWRMPLPAEQPYLEVEFQPGSAPVWRIA